MLHRLQQAVQSLTWPKAASLTAVVALLLYMPTLHFEFLNWDDDGYVATNPALAYPWFEFLEWAFTTFRQGNWHPLTWISLRSDFALWGLNPLGYHLTNVVLHAINSFLLVVLLARLFIAGHSQATQKDSAVFALGVGLIFAVHPLHVESVAWVSERKDLLFAAFYLLSMIGWLAWVEPVHKKRLSLYFASFLFYALSLFSKPMAVSLPIVLLLLDLYPLRRAGLGLRLLWEKTPFIALTCFAAAITVMAQADSQAVASVGDWSLSDRLVNAARALFFYVWKGLVPADLSPFYQLQATNSAILIQGIISALVLATLAWWALRSVGRSPIPFVLLAVFVVMLLPTLGIVQVGSQFAADRYMYLPIVPLTVAVSLLVSRIGDHRWLSPAAGAVLTLCAVAVLSLLTIRQMTHWHNSESLWKKVIAQDFEVPTAHFNLGNHYLAVNRLDLAESEWAITVRLNPTHSLANNQLGNLSFFNGDFAAALNRYSTAVQADPANQEAAYNYALVLDRLGRVQDARQAYQRFLELATDEYQAQAEAAVQRVRQIDASAQR